MINKKLVLTVTASFILASCSHQSYENKGAERNIAREQDSKVAVPTAILSVLQNPKDGKAIIVTHKAALGELIVKKAHDLDDRMILSYIDKPEWRRRIVDLFAKALVEYFSESSMNGRECFVDDVAWNLSVRRLLIDHAIIRDDKLLVKVLKKSWAKSTCSVERKVVVDGLEKDNEEIRKPLTAYPVDTKDVTVNYQEKPGFELTTNGKGQAVINTLLFTSTALTKEVPFIKTDRGNFSVIGSLVSISYQDEAESTPTNFISDISEYGADIMMAFKAKDQTFGIGTYAYQYGNEGNPLTRDAVLAGEIYVRWTKNLSKAFSVNTEFRLGNQFNGEKASYQAIRVYGSVKF